MADPASRAGSDAILQRLAATATAQMAHENFPVALRILPRTPRAELARIYTFARFVDDVGDLAVAAEADGPPAGQYPDAAALLDEVAADIGDIATGRPHLAPVAGVAELVHRHDIPLTTLLDLVEANRVDQAVHQYETFADLLGYCRLSAAPIGRLVLHVAGAATPANITDSDAVCAALQVLEHCQDVGEDARAGRIYLPAADLRALGVGPSDLRGNVTSGGLRRVVADQVHRSRELLTAGSPLVGRLTGWARWAVAGYVAGGLATADALERAGHDVLPATVRPSRIRTAGHAGRLALGRRG